VSDADCRLHNDLCDGCTCRAISGDPPVCWGSDSTDCFRLPCGADFDSAKCVAGECVACNGDFCMETDPCPHRGCPGPTECVTAADCDEGNPCTIESCNEGRCERTTVSCEPALGCSASFCDPSSGTCGCSKTSCVNDEECRLFDDQCDGCVCRGISGDPPVCERDPTDCWVRPCNGFDSAKCVAGECVACNGDFCILD
jgi:hypothetical protein